MVGSFEVPPSCLACGRSPIVDDYTTGTASMDGTTMATLNNRCGVLCVACTQRERAR
jgi:hypothetical protein